MLLNLSHLSLRFYLMTAILEVLVLNLSNPALGLCFVLCARDRLESSCNWHIYLVVRSGQDGHTCPCRSDTKCNACRENFASTQIRGNLVFIDIILILKFFYRFWYSSTFLSFLVRCQYFQAHGRYSLVSVNTKIQKLRNDFVGFFYISKIVTDEL